MRKCPSRYNGFFVSIVLLSLFVGNGCGTLLKHRVEPASHGLDTEAWYRNQHLSSIWNPRFSRVVIEIDYTPGTRPYESAIKAIRKIIEKYCVHIREVKVVFSDCISGDDLQKHMIKRRIYENKQGVILSVSDDVHLEASVAGFGKGFVFKGTREEINVYSLAREFQNVPLSDETYLIYVWSNGFSESGEGGGQFSLSLTGGNKAGITLERKVLKKMPVLFSTRTVERITALHELGHLLGLVENPSHHWSHFHCTNPACVMYPGKGSFRVVLANWWTGLLGWTGLVPQPKSKFCSKCRADLCLYRQMVANASQCFEPEKRASPDVTTIRVVTNPEEKVQDLNQEIENRKWQEMIPKRLSGFGKIIVKYEEGFEKQAEDVCSTVLEVYKFIKDIIGMPVRGNVKIYLLTFKEPPKNYQYVTERENKVYFDSILLFTHGDLTQQSADFLFFALPQNLLEKTLLRAGNVKYHGTRWFREGLANYGAFMFATKQGRNDLLPDKWNDVTILEKLKGKLLEWPSSDAGDRWPGYEIAELYSYYCASFQLMQHISEEVGSSNWIGPVLARLKKGRSAGTKEIITAIRAETDVDVYEICR